MPTHEVAVTTDEVAVASRNASLGKNASLQARLHLRYKQAIQASRPSRHIQA